MLKIAAFFWQLCLLRGSPGDLPSSGFVVTMALAVHLGAEILAQLVVDSGDFPLWQQAASIASGILLPALVTWALLRFKAVGNRFAATFSALLVTGAILHLLRLPFALLQHSDLELLQLFANSAGLVIFIWWLGIAGHIYHQAAGVSALLGGAIALLTEVGQVMLILAFIAPPA